jgi:NADP-dependent 3-hydroxy acid dehydrogenase YdfG
MVKNILLTGATSGIGAALVKMLDGNENYFMILLGRNQDKLDEIKTVNSITYCVDMLNTEEIELVSKEILSTYTIDILINNAGLGIPTQLDSEDVLEKYTTMMDTNVKSVVQLTSQILKQMKEQQVGHIINISSEAGLASNPVAPIYCSTKHALEAYSSGLRMQLKGEKIPVKVTLIRPGQVATNYWAERVVPKEKFLTPEEVANTIKYAFEAPENVSINSIDLESTRF